MRYVGSKDSLRKYILPYIKREPYQHYYEPFVGMAGMFRGVSGPRYGSDFNGYLIEMLKACRDGWTPPEFVSIEEYYRIKHNIKSTPKHLVGYVGFNSYGGKWFSGYPDCSGNIPYWAQTYNSFLELRYELQGAVFGNHSFEFLKPEPKSVIYCDPPYKGTTGYGGIFDTKALWSQVRIWVAAGHKVYVSEYQAPPDFECIWFKQVASNFRDRREKKAVERLFVHRSQYAGISSVS